MTDVSHEAGVDWLDYTASALLIDLDNDGDQDMVATVHPLVVFACNVGLGVFEIRNTLRVVNAAHSLSAADYDEDGIWIYTFVAMLPVPIPVICLRPRPTTMPTMVRPMPCSTTVIFSSQRDG